MKEATATGKVVTMIWGKGTKSEHETYALQTGDQTFPLKRQFFNRFELDVFFEQFHGKDVTVSGQLLNTGTFVVSEVPVLVGEGD